MPAGLFGRYEIRQEIGRGGMAQVYLAYDPTFRRQVAVKVLPPHYLENPLLRVRFEREARLIATIEHPAIVPVYDFGEQEGQLYLVMRYMPGGSLVSIIRQGPLSLGKASELLTLLAPALDAVHGQGIIHRDLKPGNILFDAFGNPALSDFGIAHLSEATVDLTGEAIIGTPAYMSPEQVRAEVPLDGRSDIYSLGIILYEMLTGRQPYQAATPMSIAMRHLTDSVPEIHRLRPELPEPLQTVLEHVLAKDRDKRYSQATELAYDLRALVDASPAKDYPLTPKPPAGGAQQDKPASNRPKVPVETASSMEATEVDSQTGSAPVIAALMPDRPSTAEIATDITEPPVSRITSMPGAGKPAPSRAPRIGLIAAMSGLVLVPLMCLLVFLAIPGIRDLLPFGSPPLLTATSTEDSSSHTPANTPEPAAATLPGAAATRAATLQPTPVFFDDFSSPANGWPDASTDEGGYTYLDGAYSISVLQNGSLYWAAPDGSFSDLSVHVEAGRASGEQGYYGLLCRIQDSENYYYFIIRPDGYFTIGIYQAGTFTALTPGGWTFHRAIQTGDAINDLQAECVGDELRLSANGELLGEARDSAFKTGRSGLIAAALDQRGFQAVFDNFAVFTPLP
jgi:serine/threonine-protein kinase